MNRPTSPLRVPITGTGRYLDGQSRWEAVCNRDPLADRAFVYCVRTTKCFCRPVCKARLPRRANTTFYTTPSEAKQAGYRACKRCKPEIEASMPEDDAVRKILDFIMQSPEKIDVTTATLDEMAKNAGLSKWHFHRVFKRTLGVTPNEYAKGLCGISSSASESPLPISPPLSTSPDSLIAPELQPSLDYSPEEPSWELLDILAKQNPVSLDSETTTVASFDKTPIQYTFQQTNFGMLLIAYQNGQVCQLNQGENVTELAEALELNFPSTFYSHIPVSFSESERPIQNHINSVISLLERPATG